jgi:hypothetical protein
MLIFCGRWEVDSVVKSLFGSGCCVGGDAEVDADVL